MSLHFKNIQSISICIDNKLYIDFPRNEIRGDKVHPLHRRERNLLMYLFNNFGIVCAYRGDMERAVFGENGYDPLGQMANKITKTYSTIKSNINSMTGDITLIKTVSGIGLLIDIESERITVTSEQVSGTETKPKDSFFSEDDIPVPNDSNFIRGQCGENVWYIIDKSRQLMSMRGYGRTYEECYDLFAETCLYFNKVIVEEGITYIGKQLLTSAMCTSYLSLPSTLEEIPELALPERAAITHVSVSQYNRNYVMKDKILYTSDYKTIILAEKDIAQVKIHPSVEYIYPYAFSHCTKIKSITIPEGVQTLPGGIFLHGINLTEVILPESMTQFSWDCFYGCTELSEIRLPSNLDSIGSYCFCRCKNLKTITIPGSVKKILWKIFESCDKLEAVIFEGNAPKVGDGILAATPDSARIYRYSDTTGWDSEDWLEYKNRIIVIDR